MEQSCALPTQHSGQLNPLPFSVPAISSTHLASSQGKGGHAGIAQSQPPLHHFIQPSHPCSTLPTSLPPSAKVATLKVLPARPPIWRFSVRPCGSEEG